MAETTPKTKPRKPSNKGVAKKIHAEEVKALKSSDLVQGEVMPRKVGRPSKYNQDIAARICFELSQGKSVRTVAAMDGMPEGSTIFYWLHNIPEFSDQYTQAKQEAADAMAEDILDISDDGSNDWMERNFGGNEVWLTNGEALQRSRLRVDTRKWLMAKMKPRKYGDKIDITSDGEKLPAPLLGGASIIIDDVKKPKLNPPSAEKDGDI